MERNLEGPPNEPQQRLLHFLPFSATLAFFFLYKRATCDVSDWFLCLQVSQMFLGEEAGFSIQVLMKCINVAEAEAAQRLICTSGSRNAPKGSFIHKRTNDRAADEAHE